MNDVPESRAPKDDGGLDQYVIYDRPADAPDKVVVRRWTISHRSGMRAGMAWQFDDIYAARAHVQQVMPGAVRLPRSPGDDPVIREVWL